MAGKYLTVIVGSLLLIGCLVGIAILIVGQVSDDSLPRDSYKTFHRDHSSFEDWNSKHIVHPGVSVKKEQTTNNESADFADKFQVLFSKNSSVNHTPSIKTAPPHILLSNKRLHNVSTSSVSTTSRTTTDAPKTNEYSSVNINASKGIQLDIIHQNTDTGQYWRPIIPTTGSQGHFSRKPPSSPSVVPRIPGFEPTATTINQNQHPVSPNIQAENEMVEEDENANDEEGDEEDEDQYDGLDENDAETADDDDSSPLLDFTSMLEQISSLYSLGLPNLHRMLQFLNETVSKENTGGLLTQLNNLYSRPEILQASSLGSEMFSGRNSYESSLSAFVFMSFGVFLLNQIHNLIAGTKSVSADGSEARDFHSNSLALSKLNILFEPPPEDEDETGNVSSVNDGNATMRMTMEDLDSFNSSSVGSPAYVDNMFRALLNLVNAYTKDPQVMECIWSSYCDDLDRTSAQDGLYGIAARINSIGLRLIMHQISSELTLDVMLRSLLGWDGLPCAKMFPVCHVNSSAIVLQFSEDSNHTRPSSPQPINLLYEDENVEKIV